MAVTVIKQGQNFQVECGKCRSTLQYTPEDYIKEYTGNSYRPVIRYIECPNSWCKFHTRVS